MMSVVVAPRVYVRSLSSSLSSRVAVLRIDSPVGL